MSARRTRKATPACSTPELPQECLHAIFERLPPNCIPLAIRQLSKELRQHYLQHTNVQAAGDGCLPAWAVLAALPHLDEQQQPKLLPAVARRGDLQGMQQLVQQLHLPAAKAYVDWQGTLCAAAANGRLDIVRWLVVEKDCGVMYDYNAATARAAGGGHVHVLEWLRRQGRLCLLTTRAFAAAARGGHVATLQWLRSKGLDQMDDLWVVCTAAAEGGQLETLIWLRMNGYHWNANGIMLAAVRHGQLNVVRYMREDGFQWDEDDSYSCGSAAATGNVDLLSYMMEQGCPTNGTDLCAAAARAGHKDMLLWLRQHGHPWTERTFAAAAARRDVLLLQWLRAQGPPCPWDSSVVLALACPWQGSRQCLEYVLSNGCPWDAVAFREVQKHPGLRGVHFPGVRRSSRRQC